MDRSRGIGPCSPRSPCARKAMDSLPPYARISRTPDRISMHLSESHLLVAHVSHAGAAVPRLAPYLHLSDLPVLSADDRARACGSAGAGRASMQFAPWRPERCHKESDRYRCEPRHRGDLSFPADLCTTEAPEALVNSCRRLGSLHRQAWLRCQFRRAVPGRR